MFNILKSREVKIGVLLNASTRVFSWIIIEALGPSLAIGKYKKETKNLIEMNRNVC